MNKTGNKLIAGLTVFSLVLSSSITSVMAESPATASQKKNRLWGANRYETAVKVSQSGWKTSDYVVLASGQEFADALCAAPLAKKLDAPILLTEGNGLYPAVKDEIKRLNAKHVVIIGLNGAVSSAAENDVKSLGIVPERIGGNDRYETSAKIAEKIGTSSKIVLASGEAYPDALSIAPIAAMENMPILLTQQNELSKPTADYISQNKSKITKTYVVGETGAVSEEAANAADKKAVRLGGDNRFETNAEVLQHFADELNYKNIYLAVGDGADGSEFADALSGSVLAAKTNSPVVLVYNDLNEKTQEAVKKQIAPKKNVIALGGEAVLKDSVIDNIDALEVDAVVYSKDGETKTAGDVTKANVELDAKNVTLKDANVSGNVYIYGDGAKLSNVKVAGTVYVDPGENGSVTLENVHADKIRVRSGAQNSIHLISVIAGKLQIESDNDSSSVRVVSSGTTNINNTIVTSYAIIDSKGGTLGTVTVTTSAAGESTVELSGNYTAPVLVGGGTKVKVNAGAAVASIKAVGGASIEVDKAANVQKVELATLGNETVSLAGKIAAVDLKSSAKLQLAANTSIGSLAVSKDAKEAVIDAAKGATAKVTGDGAKLVKVSGDGAGGVKTEQQAPSNSGNASSGGSGSSSSGGNDGPVVTKHYYHMNLAYGGLTYDINLGEESAVKNSTLSQLYDAKVKNMKSSDDVYFLINTLINMEIEKSKPIKIGTKNLNEYYADKLLAKNPGSSIGNYLKSGDSNANDQITKYICGKSFNEMYDLLSTKTSGDITVPHVTNPQLTDIQVLDIASGKYTTYKPGDSIKISDVEAALNLSGSSRFTTVTSMTNAGPILVANLSNGSYKVAVSGGLFTLTTPSNKTYTISFSLK